MKHFNVNSWVITCPCDIVIPQATQNLYYAVNSISSKAILNNGNNVIYKAGNFI